MSSHYLSITLPAEDLGPIDSTGTLLCAVDISSPLRFRHAMWRAGRAFHRELGFDGAGYGFFGHETDPDHSGLLWLRARWHDWDYGCPERRRVRMDVIGAACFRVRDPGDSKPTQSLQWIWIHPFHRRDGILSHSWPLLRERFGDFFVEPPLTRAMATFLSRRDDVHEANIGMKPGGHGWVEPEEIGCFHAGEGLRGLGLSWRTGTVY